MYKKLGKLGEMNFRSVRYYEDIQAEKRERYHLGFDINLLPVIKLSNSPMRVRVVIAWLTHELIWWRYKECTVTYDIQGNEKICYKGVRYFLSLKWLFTQS